MRAPLGVYVRAPDFWKLPTAKWPNSGQACDAASRTVNLGLCTVYLTLHEDSSAHAVWDSTTTKHEHERLQEDSHTLPCFLSDATRRPTAPNPRCKTQLHGATHSVAVAVAHHLLLWTCIIRGLMWLLSHGGYNTKLLANILEPEFYA